MLVLGGVIVSIFAVLFVGVSLFLMLVILVQKPKGGGLSGAFGGAGGAVQTAFGSKVGDLLTWVTVVCFALFLLLAMALTWKIGFEHRAAYPPAASAQPRADRTQTLIRSMTGYGEASEQVGGVFYAVEIRSLNNRFFKASIRLPETIGALEAEIEAQLRRRLGRGSITMTGVVRDPSASAALSINDAALLTYLGHLETLHGRFADKQRAVSIDLTALLALPGVLQPGDPEALLRQARPVLQRVTDAACEKLLAMRAVEGLLIADDLSRQRQVIRERMEIIRTRAPQVIEEYHQRLRTRIDELMQRAQLALDQKDLVREIAIFAERADIAEEVSRLASHLGQFETMTAEGNREPAGRTVEFLAQEMLREANTIASKSNDATISRAIVEIKGAIDRIKEQAQNIE